jgi:hypothetical protein
MLHWRTPIYRRRPRGVTDDRKGSYVLTSTEIEDF